MKTRIADKNSELLKQQLSKNPSSFVFSQLADTYRKEGDISQAVELCKQGIEIHPEYITGRIILGRCYIELEDYDNAIKEFIAVCRMDRHNQVAIKIVADLFVKQGKLETAGDLYRVLLRMDPFDQSFKILSSRFDSSGKVDLFRILGIESAISPATYFSGDVPGISDGEQEPFGDAFDSFAPDVPDVDSGVSTIDSVFNTLSEEDQDTPADNDSLQISGADIDSRMEALFGQSNDAQQARIYRGETEFIETSAKSVTDDAVSGSDISSRIDELFAVPAIGESEDVQNVVSDTIDPNFEITTEISSEKLYESLSIEQPSENSFNVSHDDPQRIESTAGDTITENLFEDTDNGANDIGLHFTDKQDVFTDEFEETIQFDRSVFSRLTDEPDYEELAASSPFTSTNQGDDVSDSSSNDTIPDNNSCLFALEDAQSVVEEIADDNDNPVIDSELIDNRLDEIFSDKQPAFEQFGPLEELDSDGEQVSAVEKEITENRELNRMNELFDLPGETLSDTEQANYNIVEENQVKLDINSPESAGISTNPDDFGLDFSESVDAMPEFPDVEANESDANNLSIDIFENLSLVVEENDDSFLNSSVLEARVSDVDEPEIPEENSEFGLFDTNVLIQTVDAAQQTSDTDVASADEKDAFSILDNFSAFKIENSENDNQVLADSSETPDLLIDVVDSDVNFEHDATVVSDMDVLVIDFQDEPMTGDDVAGKIQEILDESNQIESRTGNRIDKGRFDIVDDTSGPLLSDAAEYIVPQFNEHSVSINELSIVGDSTSNISDQDNSGLDIQDTIVANVENFESTDIRMPVSIDSDNDEVNDIIISGAPVISGNDVEERIEEFFGIDVLGTAAGQDLIPDDDDAEETIIQDFYTVTGENTASVSGTENLEIVDSVEIDNGTDQFETAKIEENDREDANADFDKQINEAEGEHEGDTNVSFVEETNEAEGDDRQGINIGFIEEIDETEKDNRGEVNAESVEEINGSEEDDRRGIDTEFVEEFDEAQRDGREGINTNAETVPHFNTASLFEEDEEQDSLSLQKASETHESDAINYKIDSRDRPYAIPDHVLTPTLADIYYQQGQYSLAHQIYTRLLERDPENDKLRNRLDEIKEVMDHDPPVDLQNKHFSHFDTLQSAIKRTEATKSEFAQNSTRPLAGVRIPKKKGARKKASKKKK